MPIAEEHLHGMDPTTAPLRLPGCPIQNKCAFVVWTEIYGFTFWSAGIFRNTGIGYSRTYVAFDLCGNILPTLADCAFSTAAFGGNRTVLPWQRPTTFAEWLAFARDRPEIKGLPNPGTVQFTDLFHQVIGWRG